MGRVAIVTGAGSGIGRALATALSRRGDRVVCADIDGAAATAVASALPGATAAELDVRDADAVASLVDRVAADHGRIDLMVNNAGIGVGGELLELSVAHWDRVIDVNLRGVVHGVQAAYPVMARQGHGHLVNVASLAGLAPAPLLTPYAATKHAVVGLSLSLRLEAAAYGVRVTAVCPSFVDTPLLDKGGPDDLPKPRLAGHTRELATRFGRGLYPVDALARDVVAGLDRNRALIVVPGRARFAWTAQRLAPWLVERVNLRAVAGARARVGAALEPPVPGPPAAAAESTASGGRVRRG